MSDLILYFAAPHVHHKWVDLDTNLYRKRILLQEIRPSVATLMNNSFYRRWKEKRLIRFLKERLLSCTMLSNFYIFQLERIENVPEHFKLLYRHVIYLKLWYMDGI